MEKMVEFLLSDEGEFLRDAIVEDVVDTVDSVQLDALERISKLTLGMWLCTGITTLVTVWLASHFHLSCLSCDRNYSTTN